LAEAEAFAVEVDVNCGWGVDFAYFRTCPAPAGKPAGLNRIEKKELTAAHWLYKKTILGFIMKTKLHTLFIGLVLFASLAETQTACAAVTFSVTPAAVSNTFSGYITLQVGGLTNGETVVVQKFLDLNNNGVIDGSDWLVQQFTLTDGQAGMAIGGVTNFNVPGDTDGAANGQITAMLYFENGDVGQSFIGNYLYMLSSPVGHFAPITNQFAVTNYPFPQQFTGTVVSNGVAVPYAAILLSSQSWDGLHAAAVANGSGSYSIQLPAGTYSLVAVKNNFIGNTNAAANLVLGGNAAINTNLSLIAATQTISGKIVDTNNSSVGLPGFFLGMQSTNGLLGVCFTDTNGNFNAPVNSNQWALAKSYHAPLALHGYLGLQSTVKVNTQTGSVSNLTIALPKATALVYGAVKDGFGNPFPGAAEIHASDGNYYGDGWTDTNGNYVVVALGGLGNNDIWGVNVDDYPNYVFSQQTISGIINAGQAVLQNFTFTNTLVPLQVTTTSLPNGTNGLAYSQQLSAAYGQPPYSWTNSSGALPPGLTLATNGMISGTPTNNGTFSFTVKVTDVLSATATQALALTVLMGPPIVVIQPSNSSVWVTVGSNVTFSVTVSGTGPFSYQWQLNGTNLPNAFIYTVAGNGGYGYNGDGRAATDAELNWPTVVAVDATGNLFIADSRNNVIREVGTNRIINTVAGNGTWGYSGDGGAAANAELRFPSGVAVDATGNLFIADSGNNVIREVGTNGIINTVAGNGYGAETGYGGYSGDGGAATNAELDYPSGVALDATGNLFIVDSCNNVIRKVGTNGIINTVAGNGYGAGAGGNGDYSGDGGLATNAELNLLNGVAVDATGKLFIADSYNQRIRVVGTNGIINTVAGNGPGNPTSTGDGGFSGDGGAATNAELNYPSGVALDTTGKLFIADTSNQRIRVVGTNGIINTVAGNGYEGYSGDRGAATNAELNYPYGVAVDATGNLFIADTSNNCIRNVVFPGPTLALNDVSLGNAGAYDVVVSSPYGSVTSSVVNLIIPPFVSAPQITVGKTDFTFLLSGPPGSNYVLQVSTDLLNWSPVSTSTIPVGGSINLTNAISGYNQCFYRACLQ